MARIVRLIRRITATGGTWAGDGTVWSGDASAAAPKPATINAVEVGHPIARVRGSVNNVPLATQGWSGILIVRDGNGVATSKRFELRLVLGWEKVATGVQVTDWRQPTGDSPPTPPDARNIGDGEDFTTAPLILPNQDVAFHLVPIGGDLALGHKVEIWASEIPV